MNRWFAIFNEANKEFNFGFPAKSPQHAIQIFKAQILQSQELRIIAEDLELWDLGCTYDTKTGTFIQKSKEMKVIERGDKYAIKIFDIGEAIRSQNSLQ